MKLSRKAESFKPGIYRHFKGGMYEAFFVAHNSENHEEELVVYKSLDKGSMWVRPFRMFFDTVERDGYKGPRFVWVGDTA